ncbi:MAG: helix-turn-helix domain-containing protein [Rhodospirillaceae bacterium]|nr:helix-turn-helix domain-containing protein [Rhodospirillaceae bacterium]
MSGVSPLEIVERAITVLRNINSFDGVTVSELAKLSGVTRAAVNRYLVTWEQLGYVERNPTTRKYTVTPKVLEFSCGSLRDDWITTHVRPHLIQTCKVMGWPLGFAAIRNSQLTVLENTDAESSMIVYPMREHMTLPLVGRSAGHVLLAYKPEDVRKDILSAALAKDRYLFTRTQMDPGQFENDLKQTRNQGYALSKVPGVNWGTLSVPVEVNGDVDFALSNRFHPSAIPLDRAAERFLLPLRKCAKALLKTLKSIRPE